MTNTSLDNLKRLYFFLDENFDDLIAKCETDEQRQQLRHDYVVARDSFYKARNTVFHDDDPIVGDLNTQLKGSQQQMEDMLAGLKKISEILGLMTDAVNIAGRLLALAGV